MIHWAYQINKYAWEGGGFNLGRIIGGNIAISTSFKSKPKDSKESGRGEKKSWTDQMPMTIDEQQAQLDYITTKSGRIC